MSTITTAAGLDALPIGSVVRSSAGTIGCRYDERRGLVFGDDRCFPWTGHLAFPLTVLYRPDQPQRTVAEIKAEALRGAAETAEDALSESEHQQWDYDWICYLRETADRLEVEARP